MRRPKITLTLVEKKGAGVCHHGHKVGDTFDFDTERGRLCPMALHTAFPYVDILRYGGAVSYTHLDVYKRQFQHRDKLRLRLHALASPAASSSRTMASA